uniref:Uncharacterized protein n=1 Tax=Panagrolaimus sp. JU765 TaxID=591449 RepID=A0AC34Q9Y5_9BILA
MPEDSTIKYTLENRRKAITPRYNINYPKDESVSANIFIHVYDDESREFTSYTTFHGMIRIFNSNTWTSLIYWSFVVMICLTFYYFYSFDIIYRYTKKPTYQMIDRSTYESRDMIYPQLIICPVNTYSQKAINDYVNSTYVAENLEDFTLRPTRWHLSELNQVANMTMDYVDALQKKLFKNCFEMIARTAVDEIDFNLCDFAEPVKTAQTYCLAFDLNKLKKRFNKLMIRFKNQDDAGYRIFVEAHGIHPLTYSHFFHLRPNTRMSVYTKLRNDTFLPKENWGNCLSSWEEIPAAKTMQIHDHLPYSIKLCEHVRVANAMLTVKGCIPYSLKKLFSKKFPICNHTMAVELDDDLVNNLEVFQCFPECNRLEYDFLRVSSRFMGPNLVTRNISILKLTMDKNIKVLRSQSRLIYIVDVLSKMGGNTSLFCGFSCVTLMETFIFLFKSVVHLAYYGNRDAAEKDEPKKSLMKLISVRSDNMGTTISIDLDNTKEISISLPSSPVAKTTRFSFSKKTSSSSDGNENNTRQLVPTLPNIDTISEKDESEIPTTPQTPEPPRERIPPAFSKRRKQFRESVHSMTADSRSRVREPVAFQARISMVSVGGYSDILPNATGRRFQRPISNLQTPLSQFKSGIGDF